MLQIIVNKNEGVHRTGICSKKKQQKCPGAFQKWYLLGILRMSQPPPAGGRGVHLMDYEKLVADLRDWLPPESEKIPYGELVGAPYPYNLQGPLVYSDGVCNLVEEAADAITALLDENARLKNRKSMWRKLLEAIKSAFGWGTKERRKPDELRKAD